MDKILDFLIILIIGAFIILICSILIVLSEFKDEIWQSIKFKINKKGRDNEND